MKCKHEKRVSIPIGARYAWENFHDYWCPNCGAYREADESRWTYPKLWRIAQKKEKAK